ncbi:MAG TPA: hypothetical protein VMD05_00490 [Candidatus Nanoarchaeia archaeon]|nr:hypothetical protein [Candidatus Nanoarchaeia archaeon]
MGLVALLAAELSIAHIHQFIKGLPSFFTGQGFLENLPPVNFKLQSHPKRRNSPHQEKEAPKMTN